MDSNSLYYSLELVAGSGHTLNLEQRTALQTSLVILKKNYKFHRVLFWGKILGLKTDYFIAQGRGEDELEDKKNLYSFNCMDWFLLPPASDSMINEVSKATKGRFIGDPSYVYEHLEIRRRGEGDDAEEEEIVTKVIEESRLAVTVHLIDEEVSVVPRGAFVKNPHGLVEMNRSFGGLSHSEAAKLDNFLHFSKPKNLKKKSILEMGELNPAIDFFDVLSDDIPKGSWSLQFECASKVCVLRSLLWLGLTFYHVPMTPQHGYIYIGYGTKNLDLPFML
ncbi:radial spoke head protein 9 homolog [Anabas testudineus]|uniref:Radial spoke head protein 9 homolog n=1 Tax=Anabas testudineus TaxID=64144 RepID=A0A3Q1IJT6_ANATE|nr:radial spoke head protein 9 homolog [Anabas testudineus]